MTDPRNLIVHAEREQADFGVPHATWTLPDGSLWTAIHRMGDRHLMRFPGLADFLVSAEGSAECYPVHGIDIHTIEHLHQNQVIPAALSQCRHQPVFHAAAVTFDSAAIALIGVSGRGKSTLSAYLALNGHPLLTDDGMELTADDTGYCVQPAGLSLRLWHDSSAALLPVDAPRAPALTYSSKQRFVEQTLIPSQPSSKPLIRAYFLGDTDTDSIEIEAIPAHEAHLEWTKHTFLLDPHDTSRMRSLFEQASRLASLGISYRLNYPRHYGMLPAVADALRKHASLEGLHSPSG